LSALEVKEAIKGQLLQTPGFVGIGIGDPPVEPDHLLAYVETPDIQVPDQIGGIKVIKKVVGKVIAHAVINPRLRYRPYLGGVSVGVGVDTGTLGLVVTDVNTKVPYILSNNHVLAGTDTVQHPVALAGSIAYQPSMIDGGLPTDLVGSLLRWIKIDEVNPNTVDCALAQINDATQASPDVLGLGALKGIVTPAAQMPVVKCGRTTGITNSKILDISATIGINYGSFTGTFDDQIIIDNPSGSFDQPGDSGSVICTPDPVAPGLLATGLLFAGSNSITVANKFINVAKALGITVAGANITATSTIITLLPDKQYYIPGEIIHLTGYIARADTLQPVAGLPIDVVPDWAFLISLVSDINGQIRADIPAPQMPGSYTISALFSGLGTYSLSLGNTIIIVPSAFPGLAVTIAGLGALAGVLIKKYY